MLRRDERRRCLTLLTVVATLAIHLALASGSFVVLEECPGASQVPQIRHRAQGLELSLVLYYTSWNEKSVRARDIFAEVAHYYYEPVHFAAVDCWHLACNCSRTATSVTGAPRQWPSLMVHYGSGQITLEYHGEWEFAALTHFIDALFQPLERVHNKADLRALHARSDAVILGLFAHPNCREYAKFASAAVKWLETDPEQSFRFAVAFGASADVVLLKGMQSEMPLILIISNRGVEAYNSTDAANKWNASQIVWWTQMELKRHFSQVHGYTTPASLAVQIKSGPVLAIFTNDWLDRRNDFYALMEQVLDPVVVEPIRMQFAACELYWINEDEKYEALQMQQEYEQQHEVLSTATLCHRKEYLGQHNLQHYYVINTYLSSLLIQYRSNAFYDQIYDQNSADKLLELYQHNRCLRHPNFRPPEMRLAIAKFLKKSTDRLWLHSLPPQRNRTLSIAVLDTAQHEDFLENHGLTHSRLSAAVTFIVDARQEQLFVMQEKFTYNALLDFAQSYYDGSLNTAHKVSSIFRPPMPPTTKTAVVRLHDLNRQVLMQVLQQPPQQQNVTTVLLLYSPQCALSAIMSQTLLQLTALLSGARDDIRFVRLNVQTNDLPWELVMPSTPALLVFPRDRYPESRIFPTHLKADVRNVFGFILAQLGPVEQVKLALGSCRRSLLSQQRLEKCLQFVKQLIMRHIGHHLKIWQIFENERHFVVDRLKQFTDIMNRS